MYKIIISSPPRPQWSSWYIIEPFILSKKGVFNTINLQISAEGELKNTLSVQLEYYHNGKKTEQHYVGFEGTISIEVGDDSQDVLHSVKLRVQNNSSLVIPPQEVFLFSNFQFTHEATLQFKYGKSVEERKREEELRYYQQKLEQFKEQNGISDSDITIPENANPAGMSGFNQFVASPQSVAASGMVTALSSIGNALYTSIMPAKGVSRSSNLNIESLLGAEISRSADSIVDRIIGRNPNMFQASAGRFLSQSVERFGKALNEGRIRDVEDAFTSVLDGKNGAMGFASTIGNQVAGSLLQAGLDKLFGGGKATTRSFESARSLQAARDFRMSRGQQAAEALAQLQKGQRNL